MANRFSDEWMEHLAIVNTIMIYKLNTDKWNAEESERRVKEMIEDSHSDIERVERKLNLIMKKLGIVDEEVPE